MNATQELYERIDAHYKGTGRLKVPPDISYKIAGADHTRAFQATIDLANAADMDLPAKVEGPPRPTKKAALRAAAEVLLGK